jgi:hypothetical protein
MPALAAFVIALTGFSARVTNAWFPLTPGTKLVSVSRG